MTYRVPQRTHGPRPRLVGAGEADGDIALGLGSDYREVDVHDAAAMSQSGRVVVPGAVARDVAAETGAEGRVFVHHGGYELLGLVAQQELLGEVEA